MATSVDFNGTTVTSPGAYSQIRSAIQNPISSLSTGNVLLLDTGTMGADGFGAGCGILGERVSGVKSVTTFTGLDEMREVYRGGLGWLVAKPLFKPAGPASKGASKVLYVRAAATTAAKVSLSFASGGKLDLSAVNEGTASNGVLSAGNELSRGLAFRLKVAPDPTKFILELYAGTFTGLDSQNEPYDFVAEADAAAQRITSSPAVSTVDELIMWLNRNNSVIKFVNVASTSVGGAIVAADVATNAGYKLFAGGTTVYSPAALTAALAAIANLDYTFLLSDNFGTNAQSATNTQILSHLLTQARYYKILVVAGGRDQDEYRTVGGSLSTAAFYNSNRVTVVHGGLELKRSKGGMKAYSQLYKAAAYVGLRASKEPQVPCTFKPLEMDGDLHEMGAQEIKDGLAGGVLFTTYDSELQTYIVHQDINSLQGERNSFLTNPDGTSYENSITLIAAALNKQLAVKAKLELFSQPDGVNRNTLSPLDVQQWLEGQLDKATATKTEDNLITYAANIVVTVKGDAYECSYQFEPNFPVNKLFFTGFMIDRSAQ